MTTSTGDRLNLGNLASDTSTSGTVVNFRTDRADLEFVGTFGGATITIQREAPDGATWIDERDSSGTVVSVTAPQYVPIVLPYGAKIRATMASSSGTSDVDVYIKRVRRGS